MKKVFWKLILITLFIFILENIIFAAPKPKPEAKMVISENETKDYELKDNGEVTYIKGIELNKNSIFNISGKNTQGITLYDTQGYKIRFGMEDNSKLNINIESNGNVGSALSTVKKAFTDFTLEKNSEVNIKAHFNGNGRASAKGSALSINTKNLIIKGKLNLESSGSALSLGQDTNIEFDDKSKSIIKGGYTSIFGQHYDIYGSDSSKEPKNEAKVKFKNGSEVVLIGGHWSLLATEAIFEKGSKVKIYGGNGMELLGKGKSTNVVFEEGSDIELIVKGIGFHAGKIKGSSKMNFKARTLLHDVNTYANGAKSIDIFTFEKGSILEGNIIDSPNAHLAISDGAKYFAPNTIQTNLSLEGDLYIGPRNAYEENVKNDYYSKLEEFDGVSGASEIYFGKLKEGKKNPDIRDLDPNNYYTVTWSNRKYNKDVFFNLQNSKIHLRIGGADKSGAINDKIIFSKETIINGKGELVLHKRNSSKVTKDMVFKILEEDEKKINGTPGYYLEKLPLLIKDIEFGSLVFTKKAEKINNKYIISLVFKGFAPENFLLEGGKIQTLDKKKEGSLDDAILSGKQITLEEKSTLNIKGDTNGLFAKNNITVEEEANLNIEIKKDGKVALKLGENLENFGNINIKSAGTGILTDNAATVLQFENGSKTNVNAKEIAINAQKASSEFKSGSITELVANKYALVTKKATFEKGSRVRLEGEYGIATLSETDSSDITFKEHSELNINSKNSGLYNVNAKGSSKLSIKAPSILKQVNTDNQSLKFERGSVLEGNIEKSWKANLILDKDSKLFVDKKIEANMEVKGDLFVGTRNLYEEEDRKSTLHSLSTMGSSLSSDKYYTVYYNKDSNGNKTKISFDNANIHLRINGAQSGNNDKIVFSKDTEVTGKGTEIVLHTENISKVKRNMSFSLLEEEGKDIGGKKVFGLETADLTLKKVEFGALVYGRKDKKINGKYIITLEDTGELSQAAKNSLFNSRDSYKYNQVELKNISDKIFENHNLELKSNFWLLFSKENLKNEENPVKINQNSRYAGYDYTFDTGISLGAFAGESTGKYKNIGQGIYLKKDLKPFYVGTVYKHTKSRDKEKSKNFHSNDLSFIVGYNKEISEKAFLDSNIKLTRGYTSSYEYTGENQLNIKNEKANYWNGELNTKLGYKFNYGNVFLKAGLDKDLKGEQKVVWNKNIDEKVKYDDFSKNVGIGMEFKLKHHSINIEFSKKYSKHYRANTKMSVGYSYKF